MKTLPSPADEAPVLVFSTASQPGEPSAPSYGISRAIRTIREEYWRPLTVPTLARECGISIRSLHRLHREETGCTVGRALLIRRLEAAAEMLLAEDAKLEPVAMEAGLRNAKNLCRLFKAHFGMTPGQWKISSQQSRARIA